MVTFPRAKHTLHDPLNSQTKDKLVMNNKQINASFAPSIPNGDTIKAFGFRRVLGVVGYVPSLHGDPLNRDNVGDILRSDVQIEGIETEILLGPQQLNQVLGVDNTIVFYTNNV